MMPGVAFQEIRDAIVDAYTPNDLEQSLRFLMNVRLDVVTPPADFNYRTFCLVQWAEMQGREVELMQALAKERPRNPKIQTVYTKYGMAIAVDIERAGSAASAGPSYATDHGLEKIVKPHLSFEDFGIWRERMTAVENRVCMITIDGAPQGTGFLVGPAAVLTNYHVMQPLLNGSKKAGDFECVFDFKKLSNGEKTSTPVKLHASEWQIDASPYSEPEGRGKPDETDPTNDELDYALIRLADDFGAKPWAANADPQGGAPTRGWIPLPSQSPEIKSPMGVLIAQHPSGWPLKLAIDTDAINQANQLWLNKSGTRIRYATNTLGGSSGSPVFDMDWNLIALHHYGDPDWKNLPAKYNQGVPIQAIRARLDARGKNADLGIAS